MHRRQVLALGAGVMAALPMGWFVAAWAAYPSDRSPTGAYLRIVAGVNRGEPEAFFPYLEVAAQNACCTVHEYRLMSLDRVVASYPAEDGRALVMSYEPFARASGGAGVFAVHARQRGWLDRLRRDMSRPAQVEEVADRATVVTARGTRYPFRRRADSGVWGLTLFTAALVAEAEKAARDHAMIEKAAADYERVRARERS